jgi:hypothetical protein
MTEKHEVNILLACVYYLGGGIDEDLVKIFSDISISEGRVFAR